MQFKNLTMSFGTQTIFEDVNLNIPDNVKIGVVGVNGAGKTTLFKLLMGLEFADTGKIITKNGYRIDWLPQVISDDVNNMNMEVLEYLMQARPIKKLNIELQTLYESLANTNSNQNEIFNKIEKVQKQLDYWDSYNAENTLFKIIDGVKLSDDILLKKLNELSGGQKSKVAFVKLLYSNPEIILLDEPTNHLDEESKKYIINYLKNYKGTVLIISHDVDFLDQVTTKTLFLDKRTKSFSLYDGNYSYFKRVQKERDENLLRQAQIQQQEEEKLREIINKYSSASGNRKRMAQDREKKLEKLLSNKIEVLSPNKRIKFNLDIDRESSTIPLKIENLCFRYDKESSQNIINSLNFELHRGEKFLIVGENGAGKSTLLKLIAGLLTADKGKIKLGNKTDLGYYAQELELLDNAKTILENFRDVSYSQKQLRNILARFLFVGNDVYKNVGILSPGEKSRVALAKLSMSGANLLLLDEPTNHLDPETQYLIAEVFKDYQGTMIVVSHNPDFVDNLGIERTLILPTGEISYYNRETVERYKVLNKQRRK
ncbi:ABC transporter, ATP-binding protein [human gut metagenome]|jgi:ABC transporter|uniref:ABC transporter, ATP-binding protein n=1 Tax=human gut metagenome TaxID=408170 RepID=K1SMG8_9ZZZZ